MNLSEPYLDMNSKHLPPTLSLQGLGKRSGCWWMAGDLSRSYVFTASTFLLWPLVTQPSLPPRLPRAV